jgi:hypothetical protein
MIEAVNSVVSNAPLLRGNTEQSVSDVSSNPVRAQEAVSLPQAPYISPFIYVDVNLNKAVLQIRDSDTGDVLSQYPSETALRVQQYGTRRSEQPKSQPPAQEAKVDAQVYSPGQETAAASAEVSAPSPSPSPQAQAASAAFERTAQAVSTPTAPTVVTSA